MTGFSTRSSEVLYRRRLPQAEQQHHHKLQRPRIVPLEPLTADLT
jgi:hypothetical protein